MFKFLLLTVLSLFSAAAGRETWNCGRYAQSFVAAVKSNGVVVTPEIEARVADRCSTDSDCCSNAQCSTVIIESGNVERVCQKVTSINSPHDPRAYKEEFLSTNPQKFTPQALLKSQSGKWGGAKVQYPK